MAALLLPALPRPAPTRNAPVDRDALPSYRLLAIMVGAIAPLAVTLGYSVDRHDLPVLIVTEVLLVLVAMAARGRGAGRLATMLEASVLLSGGALAAAFLSLLLATTALPYRDGLLEGVDALLLPGFGWLDMFHALHQHGRLITLMCGVYQSLQWQPFALVALLALVGRERRCWQFVRAWILTLIACVTIFPFVPAIGPYLRHGLSPAGILP